MTGFGPSFLLGRKAGSEFFSPPAGNVLSNWLASGTGGTAGLPDGWSATTVAGVAFSVISRASYRGGTVIEFQFVGTATASGVVLVQPILPVAASPGQSWRFRLFAERVGAASPSPMDMRLHWRDAGSAFLSIGFQAGIDTATIDAGSLDSGSVVAPPSTGFVGVYLYESISVSQAVNLRYKIFAPTLELVP